MSFVLTSHLRFLIMSYGDLQLIINNVHCVYCTFVGYGHNAGEGRPCFKD